MMTGASVQTLRPIGRDTHVRTVEAFVSAGSNVNAVANLRLACRELEHHFGPIAVSSVYRNQAVGFEGDDFLNLVVGFATSESPQAIVAELERLHGLAGRVRGPDPFAPRTLDLDLLLYGDAIIPDPAIRVPREDIRKYSFVLGPLAEIAPDLRHPSTGESIGGMWNEFDRSRHPLERLALRMH